jgi:hypothetical protein
MKTIFIYMSTVPYDSRSIHNALTTYSEKMLCTNETRLPSDRYSNRERPCPYWQTFNTVLLWAGVDSVLCAKVKKELKSGSVSLIFFQSTSTTARSGLCLNGELISCEINLTYFHFQMLARIHLLEQFTFICKLSVAYLHNIPCPFQQHFW